LLELEWHMVMGTKSVDFAQQMLSPKLFFLDPR
jgi:hypothetical protein